MNTGTTDKPRLGYAGGGKIQCMADGGLISKLFGSSEPELTGVLNTVDPVIPRMLARGQGKIGFVGSIAAYRGLPYSPAYCAAKAAVHAYAAGLRAGLAPHGLLISLIAPGFVATSLNRDIASWKPMQMDDARAARIMRRGLDRGRAVIAFPKLLAWGTRQEARHGRRRGPVRDHRHPRRAHVDDGPHRRSRRARR